MKRFNATRVACALAITLSLTLAACGGNKGATNTTTTNQAQSESQREANALPLSQAARVPANLHCGATPAVWVNMHTKAYHEPGDPYYGRTRNGQFMCVDAAANAGYHLAGARHRGMRNSDVNGANANSDTMGGGQRRHKRHSNSY